MDTVDGTANCAFFWHESRKFMKERESKAVNSRRDRKPDDWYGAENQCLPRAVGVRAVALRAHLTRPPTPMRHQGHKNRRYEFERERARATAQREKKRRVTKERGGGYI